MVEVSVVVPMLNEGLNVHALLSRLLTVLASCARTFEVVVVDDGSTDDTADRVREAACREPRVRLLRLTRSFGHQAALTAGLDAARGSVVITLDGDLQHPPELIPQMLDLHASGHDVVCAVSSGGAVPWLKGKLSRAFYRVFNRVCAVRLVEGAADYRLLSRSAVSALRRMPERRRFVRGLVAWTGFSTACVPYTVEPRHAGHSAYSVRRMLALAADAFTGFSRGPLHLSTLLGVFFAGAAAAAALLPLVSHSSTGQAQLLLGGGLAVGAALLLCLGIVGEYVWRLLEEVRQRPVYVLKEPPSERDTPLNAVAEARTIVEGARGC